MADVATEDGITSVQLAATTRMPSLLNTANGNAYYKKLVAGSQRLYFFDGHNVDIFTNTMQYIGGIRTPLIVDVAASDSGAFTIQNNLERHVVRPRRKRADDVHDQRRNRRAGAIDRLCRRRGVGLDRSELP